jgi:hypothetical protein
MEGVYLRARRPWSWGQPTERNKERNNIEKDGALKPDGGEREKFVHSVYTVYIEV